MPLHPSNTLRRERILSFGGAGSGKSTDYWMVARRSVMSGSDAIFYVIDTDVAAGAALSDPIIGEHLLDEDGDLIPNVVVKEAYDWVTFVAAFEFVSKMMRPQDWVMIDMISPTWSWCQNFYIRSVYKKDKSDFFMAAQAASGKPPKLEWSIISDFYNEDVLTPLLRCKGNIYVTAEAKALDSENAQEDTKIMLQPFGVMPVGQKRMPHVFQTVLWKQAKRGGEWMATTVKDRGRSQLMKAQVKDFSVDYLVKVAGWRLAG